MAAIFDGVLADFNSAYIQLVKDRTGRDLFPAGYHPGIIATWSYPETFGYTRDEIRAVWKWIAKDEDFWFKLAPLPDTEEFLPYLWSRQGDHEVYFITSRVGGAVKMQTEDWLTKWGFDAPTVLISSEKGLCCAALKVDAYIDDKNENCQDVLNQSKTSCYMLAQPWNSLEAVGIIGDITRIYSLQEFRKVIERE